jgi:hypothetical protein
MNLEKKKTRFNFIDAVIILIIIAIIGAAAYLIVNDMQTNKVSRLTGNMDFTVRISSVDEEALALFDRGVIVKDSVTGAVSGEIFGIDAQKSRYYGNVATEGDEGYIVPVSEYEDKYDVHVIIRANAEKDLRGIQYVNDTKILIGSTVYFKIPSFTSISYITDFTPMITE